MPDFYLKRNDQLPDLVVTLTGVDTLSGASIVTFKFRKRGDVTVTSKVCTIVDAQARTVRVEWDAADTLESGDYIGEFEAVFAPSSKKITFPNDGYISFRIVDDLA